MKKILCLAVALSTFVLADSFRLDEFSVNVFSKSAKKPISIEMDLIFEGRDVLANDYKIIDALNVVSGSFYSEDLITSKGKENFKTSLVSYCSKKHSVDIEAIYIQKLSIESNMIVQEIVEALKKEGCCATPKDTKK
ncbi:MAG: hypothetical protein PHN38_09500 [Sulfurospirillaceae bacterium]|nr:hypothetical protein [Sulfurospirillaceae bacterium]MDD3462951.1 hypothetical protein [Sulfurospirillaceae bacterium]